MNAVLRLGGFEITSIEHSGGACEDYDLRQDPAELANRCAGLTTSRRAQLSSWLEALGACRAGTCRSIETAPPH